MEEQRQRESSITGKVSASVKSLLHNVSSLTSKGGVAYSTLDDSDNDDDDKDNDNDEGNVSQLSPFREVSDPVERSEVKMGDLRRDRIFQYSLHRQKLNQARSRTLSSRQRLVLQWRSFKKRFRWSKQSGPTTATTATTTTTKDVEYINLDPKEPPHHLFHRFKRKSRRQCQSSPGVCIFALSAILVVLVIYGIRYVGDFIHSSTRQTGVNTRPCGLLYGVYQQGVHVFKGIPYAVAPVGRTGRWLPPRALDMESCWEEPYLANQYGTPCCQEGHVGEECEDCLYLNVWSPKLDRGAGLPVMVHIHGGGLVVGSGNTPGSMATPELVLASNMVYVSFNYRLGLFGFLALEELSQLPREVGEEPRHSAGNYGLMDQVMALQWVQDNIANFGGDPNQVTVYGEDSGATSILALLAVPETRGLYHRAWMMGPSPHYNASLADAQAQHRRAFLRQAQASSCRDVSGHDLVECLLAMSPMDLLNATNVTAWHNRHFWSLPTPDEKPMLIAIVDKSLLKKAPHDVWREGNINAVPILIGNAAEEVTDFPQPPHVDMWNVTAYQRYVTSRLAPWQDLAQQALHYYPASPDHPPAQQLAAMISDMRAICGTDMKIQVAARFSSEPVYRYIVTDLADAEQAPPRKYAFRGIDARAFFDSFDEVDMVKSKKVTHFQQQVRQTVWEFVRTGRLQGWGRFPKYTALFNAEKNSTTAYHKDQCMLWRLNAMFPDYAWIN